MAKIFGVIQEPLDRLVYRLTNGTTTASAWLAGVKITMLTTTGAKTRRQRTVPVLGLREGEDMIVIASNFGRPHNPAWYHNLRAHPNATIVVDGVNAKLWPVSSAAPSESATTSAVRRSSPDSPTTAAGRESPDPRAQA